jgi:O-succinylbenzoic acid--CoA ligase
VAIPAEASAATVAALHGIARAGAVSVPLAPTLTEAELAATLTETEPALVVDVLESLIDGEPTTTLPAASDADAPAVIVMTSGTTARPRAVVLSTAAMTASAEAWLAALPPATGWLLAVGVAHVAGLGIVWRAALAGVPLVIPARSDAEAILASLAAAPAPSHVSLVPTVLARVLDAAADAPPPSSLRAVPLGGGPIPPELVRRAVAAGWPVVPTYGLSEAGSGVTALPTAEASSHADSAGRPLPGVRIRIADPDPTGIGDIEVDTPARFSGYLGDAAGTVAALTPDGWIRTGDLGRVDPEGRLTVADRRVDRIVRGGENVSPAEVEAVLRDHPSIADVAVIGRPDPEFGQVPVAVVVIRLDGDEPDDAELARFCRARLSRAKVPVAFVRRRALPRTASGKVQRAQLRGELMTHAGVRQEVGT